MKKGALALGGIAVLVAGAIVVSSSIGAGGGKGAYHFYSGVFVRDQNSAARVYVENLTNDEVKVKVRFSTESGAQKLNVPAGGQSSAISQLCQTAACEMRAEVESKSPLVVPVLRYQDTDDNIVENRGGDFVVTRDGKRIW